MTKNKMMLFLLCCLIVWYIASNQGVMAMAQQKIALQLPHPNMPPAQTMAEIGKECERFGIDSFDVYGDFDKTDQGSFLRKFEKQIADEFGMDDAVFMPSGVMAQAIALLIHSSTGETNRRYFACHHSSHLMLHEDEAYKELLQMEPVIISTQEQVKNGYSVPPMSFHDVQTSFENHKRAVDGRSSVGETLSTLILELPHRELGGKLTSWDDIVGIRDLCKKEGVAFHCDGARIFEASAGYDKTLKEMSEPFDSVYISFYKGLGGLSGAMLMGKKDFCAQSRIWLRRFGGNLYTLLPYAVSGMIGYQTNWLDPQIMSFAEKRDKMIQIVKVLSEEPAINDVVSFDPDVPGVNMVHGYMRHSNDIINRACSEIEKETGIRVLTRVGAIPDTHPAFGQGYRSRFEWSIGNENGVIPIETHLQGWQQLATALDKSME